MHRTLLLVTTLLTSNLLAGTPETASLLDTPEKHWLPFGLELAFISQEQTYEISHFSTDFRAPRIVAPKITREDVDHLIPRELPAFIREPLVEQARQQGQEIANEQAAAARASLPVVDENLIEGIENHTETVTFKLDYSPAPFISVYAIGGRLEGHVDVAIAEPIGDLRVDYEGWVYGGGTTLSAGVGKFFTSLTGIYTYADLEGEDASVETIIIQPRVGIHGERGSLYTGAHYQSTKHTQQGTLNLNVLGDINFDIELEDAENWNWIIGGRLNITERLFVSAEGGFGERQQALVSMGYRF